MSLDEVGIAVGAVTFEMVSPGVVEEITKSLVVSFSQFVSFTSLDVETANVLFNKSL